jgi:putative ABC transport system substrate-binding protein
MLNYQSLKEADGKPADPKAIMAWTVANSQKPLVGVFDFAVRDGCVFGIAESAKEHGQESARMAREILAGKKAGELPISTAKHGLIMFNLTSAKAIGVEIPFELLELASETIGN